MLEIFFLAMLVIGLLSALTKDASPRSAFWTWVAAFVFLGFCTLGHFWGDYEKQASRLATEARHLEQKKHEEYLENARKQNPLWSKLPIDVQSKYRNGFWEIMLYEGNEALISNKPFAGKGDYRSFRIENAFYLLIAQSSDKYPRAAFSASGQQVGWNSYPTSTSYPSDK